MKIFALILTIVFMFLFAACGKSGAYLYSVEDSDGNVTILEKQQKQPRRTEPPTQAEKDLNYDNNLAGRLQSLIKEAYAESVDEAVITIERPNETERIIDVLVTTKQGEKLTDEQETYIIKWINDCFSDDLTLNVKLIQEKCYLD